MRLRLLSPASVPTLEFTGNLLLKYEIFDNNLNIFRPFYDRVVSTRLYKVNRHYFEKFIEILKNAVNLLEKGQSIEEILYAQMEFSNANMLGLSGNIAVTGDIIDE